MPLAVTDVQDEVGYLVFGQAWADLSSDKQGQITSLGAFALAKVEGYADLFAMGGSSDNAPTAWGRWLAAETARMVVSHRDQSRVPEFERLAEDSMRAAIETVGAGEIDAAASTVTYTLERVRRFVVTRCVRQGVFPTVPEVDEAIQGVLHQAYNARRWRFRRRLVRVTLAADGSVTIEKRDGSNGWTALGASEKFDMLATRRLYYSLTSASEPNYYLPHPDCVHFATADEFSRAVSRDEDDTGRPRYYRIEGKSSDDYVWHWWPFPDAEYTLYAEVFLEGPANALGDTSFAEFPPAFQPVLRDSALLRVLSDRGRATADLRSRVLEAQNHLLAEYEDVPGPSDDLGGPVDVYNDTPGGHVGGFL